VEFSLLQTGFGRLAAVKFARERFMCLEYSISSERINMLTYCPMFYVPEFDLHFYVGEKPSP